MSADDRRTPRRRPAARSAAAQPRKTAQSKKAAQPKKSAQPKKAAQSKKSAQPRKTARSSRSAQPKSTVDPRMRARRIGVTRGRARRRLRVLIGAAGIAVLLGAAIVIYVSPVLGIKTIEVKGVNDASAAEIADVLEGFKGTPVARVDSAELTDAVAALPGMDDARVDVSLGGTVRVTVSDDRPVAYAPTTDGSAALVGPTGRVLSLADAAPQDLVRLEATLEPSVGGAVPQPVVPAVDVAAALPSDLVAVTEAVGADDDGVELVLVRGVRAQVGGTDELPRKLASIATLMSARVESACLERIDVTEPARTTVSRDRACTGAPA